jgi:hypothetical protein
MQMLQDDLKAPTMGCFVEAGIEARNPAEPAIELGVGNAVLEVGDELDKRGWVARSSRSEGSGCRVLALGTSICMSRSAAGSVAVQLL